MTTIFSLSARFGAFLLCASQLAAVPAFADHPGENLNQVMAAKEASFEPITPRDAPELVWQGASGDLVSLSTLKGKVVVLSFLPNGCGSPCEAQQEKLGQTISALNSSAMREMVVFVTLSDDPQTDPREQNWMSAQGPDAESLVDASFALAAPSDRPGIFHGADFEPLNLLLYINGLTNAHPHEEPSILQRVIGWFS